uniref:Peptidase S1 domain-containing protein n=1 Tax=Steinernema glaseri TaxID=37863 RepID=A0A1I7XWC1_9BILA
MVLIAILLLSSIASSASLPLKENGKIQPRMIQKPAIHPASFDSFKQMASKVLDTNEFIFGGRVAREGQIPMQAALIYNDTSDDNLHICGGTLISPTHILTAGHCIVTMTAPAKIMVGGVNVRQNSSSTQWREIHSIYTHTDYDDNDPNVFNDIGIVEFSPAVELNNYVKLATILKNDDSLLKKGKGVASGYGVYKFNGNVSVSSSELRHVGLTIYSFAYCAQARPNTVLSYNQFCAGGKGVGMGSGDSGGPIQAVTAGKLVQLGIASYAAANAAVYDKQDKYPVVFTRVSHYCDYIEKVTNEEAKCQ